MIVTTQDLYVKSPCFLSKEIEESRKKPSKPFVLFHLTLHRARTHSPLNISSRHLITSD